MFSQIFSQRKQTQPRNHTPNNRLKCRTHHFTVSKKKKKKKICIFKSLKDIFEKKKKKKRRATNFTDLKSQDLHLFLSQYPTTTHHSLSLSLSLTYSRPSISLLLGLDIPFRNCLYCCSASSCSHSWKVLFWLFHHPCYSILSYLL